MLLLGPEVLLVAAPLPLHLALAPFSLLLSPFSSSSLDMSGSVFRFVCQRAFIGGVGETFVCVRINEQVWKGGMHTKCQNDCSGLCSESTS